MKIFTPAGCEKTNPKRTQNKPKTNPHEAKRRARCLFGKQTQFQRKKANYCHLSDYEIHYWHYIDKSAAGCDELKGEIMKRVIIVSIVGLLLACGCARLDKLRYENTQNLLKLSIGMTKSEAIAVMGHKTAGGRFGEPKIGNPYRSAILQGKDKTFEVFYYYTEVKQTFYFSSVDSISDDELTPLVFDDDKLIGWGRQLLEQNIQKYEIRMR